MAFQNQIFYDPPKPVGDLVLNPSKGWFSIVKPIARTNEVTNPSFETNTTNYTAVGGSIARSTAQQYHGSYSLAVTPTAGLNDGVSYGTISTTVDQIRAVSCKWYGAPGVRYKLSVATTGGIDLVTKKFIGTGRWQWITVIFKETSTTTRRLYFTKDNHNSTAVFYIDGVQSEVCNLGEVFPTTYIDGDQISLLPQQFPPAYGWNGARHASTSYRSGQTRDGGQVLNFDQFKFSITGIDGLGINKQSHGVLSQPSSDGAGYRTTILPPRGFRVKGIFSTSTSMDYRLSRQSFEQSLNIDATDPRQQVVLLYQEFDNLAPVGDVGKIICSYQEGLGKNQISTLNEETSIVFTQWLPGILGYESGAALTLSAQTDTLLVGYNIVIRSPMGVWNDIDAGNAGFFTSIDVDQDGMFYVTGSFTTIGGVSANRIARYNPLTETFSALGTGLNGTARSVKVGPDGRVYVVGDFTTAGGGTANRVAVWDPVGSTWSTLGTGLNDATYDLCFDGSGNLYVAGDFTTADGLSAIRIARWNGSVWSALSTGLDSRGNALACGLDGTTIYVGGSFTTAGGVSATRIASWNGTTFSALSTGLSATTSDGSIVVAGDGSIYVGGTFVTAGGLTVNGIARWNGFGWSSLGSGVSGGTANVTDILIGYDGLMYVGGSFTAVSGLSTPDSSATWNGTSFGLMDIDFPGAMSDVRFGMNPSGYLMMSAGALSNGVATYSAPQTLTSIGSALAYPVITLVGGSANGRLYQIRSYTTGRIISFSLTIFINEVITIYLGPGDITVKSNVRGDISQYVISGSSLELPLLKGSNTVAIFATGTGVTGSARWSNQYQSAGDLIY